MFIKINGYYFITKCTNTYNRGIKFLKEVFAPLVPIMIVWGVMLGTINVIKLFGNDTQTLTVLYPVIDEINNFLLITCDYIVRFIPVGIAWSTVKVLGGIEISGIILGILLVSPIVLETYEYMQGIDNSMIPIWNLKILELKKVGYQAQLLPAMMSAIFLIKVENEILNNISANLKIELVRVISLIITCVISYKIIGPVFCTIDNLIADLFYMLLISKYKLIGAILLGLVYSLLVIVGLHHTFLTIDLVLIQEGGTMVWPLITLCNIAQGSAAISVFMFYRNDLKMKSVAIISGICAFVGVTEPAIFGVNLKYKYALYSALTGAAVACATAISRNVLADNVGVSGLIGILSIQDSFISSYMFSVVIALVVPFILTMVFYKKAEY